MRSPLAKRVPMWLSRWVGGIPIASAPSTCARSSRSTSSSRARATTGGTSLGKVPSASSRLGTLSLDSTLPQRNVSPSLVRVRCNPRSASGCAFAQAATSVTHGVGIMTLADVIAPRASASRLAAFTECATPRSSPWRIRSFASAGYPSRDAMVIVCAAPVEIARSSGSKDQRSIDIGGLSSDGRAISSQVAEGYGIPQRVDGRDAVLPLAPRRTAQQVCRPWLGGDVDALPSFADAPAQPEDARRQQRHADDLVEDVLVAVPSNARAGRVLGDEDVLQCLGVEPGEPGCGNTELAEKCGHVVDLLKVPCAEVVLPPEGHDTPLAGVAMELEVPKRQLADVREELALLRGRDDVALVSEA